MIAMVKQMNLLIVDDSDLIRDRLTSLFREVAGVDNIQTADSLADAVGKVKAVMLDLVVLDIHLPDGNAIHVVESMKADKPGIQIAMLSNDASTFNRKKCFEAGVDWFFDKSTEFDQVIAVVKNAARRLSVV